MELLRQFADKEKVNRLFIMYVRDWGIKFPYVVAPNGLIDILDGPYEGKNDSMLADSNLFEKLNNHFHTLHGEPLCIYGDSA